MEKDMLVTIENLIAKPCAEWDEFDIFSAQERLKELWHISIKSNAASREEEEKENSK